MLLQNGHGLITGCSLSKKLFSIGGHPLGSLPFDVLADDFDRTWVEEISRATGDDFKPSGLPDSTFRSMQSETSGRTDRTKDFTNFVHLEVFLLAGFFGKVRLF
jgi:hypothetical protein